MFDYKTCLSFNVITLRRNRFILFHRRDTSQLKVEKSIIDPTRPHSPLGVLELATQHASYYFLNQTQIHFFYLNENNITSVINAILNLLMT